MNISDKELHDVSWAMCAYGGSLVSRLGIALQHADLINRQRIKDAFPEYWKQYKQLGERNQPKGGL